MKIWVRPIWSWAAFIRPAQYSFPCAGTAGVSGPAGFLAPPGVAFEGGGVGSSGVGGAGTPGEPSVRRLPLVYTFAGLWALLRRASSALATSARGADGEVDADCADAKGAETATMTAT